MHNNGPEQVIYSDKIVIKMLFFQMIYGCSHLKWNQALKMSGIKLSQFIVNLLVNATKNTTNNNY